MRNRFTLLKTFTLLGRCNRANVSLNDIIAALDDSDMSISGSEDESDGYEPEEDDYGRKSESSLSQSSDEDAPLAQTNISKKGSNKKQKNANKNNWKKGLFDAGNILWDGEFDIGHVRYSPLELLMKYFTEDLFETIANETNVYSMTATGSSMNTNSFEIRKFFGINILMGNINLPRIRMYWQPATRIDRIAESMPVNRFFKLRQNIHAVSAREPPKDNTNKFWKVDPVVTAVHNMCRLLPHEEYCSVDDQMIPFTERMPAKQVIKSKPNPLGIKNWVLCGKSGRALDFELYQGAGTGIPAKYKHLGLGASVVLRLAETIPEKQNYKLFFDNYFTGIPLLRELKFKGMLSLGTIKAKRLQGCVLKTEKELRYPGAIDSKVSKKGDVCLTRWLDNGVVTLASTLAGVEPQDKVKRWSDSAKEHIDVDRPYAVQLYNNFMGGVDKLDFLISLSDSSKEKEVACKNDISFLGFFPGKLMAAIPTF